VRLSSERRSGGHLRCPLRTDGTQQARVGARYIPALKLHAGASSASSDGIAGLRGRTRRLLRGGLNSRKDPMRCFVAIRRSPPLLVWRMCIALAFPLIRSASPIAWAKRFPHVGRGWPGARDANIPREGLIRVAAVHVCATAVRQAGLEALCSRQPRHALGSQPLVTASAGAHRSFATRAARRLSCGVEPHSSAAALMRHTSAAQRRRTNARTGCSCAANPGIERTHASAPSSTSCSASRVGLARCACCNAV
jgi:hypothetical protein